MDKKTAVIVSAKFTPGHISHLKAFYCLFCKLGFRTMLLLNKGYKNIFSEDVVVKYLDEDWKETKADVVLIYNMSQIDTRIINALKKKSESCKTLLVYHEPWYGIKKWVADVMERKVKPILLIKYIAIHYYAVRLIRTVDTVLLPSEKAVDVYTKHDVKHNRAYKEFPLIFTDEVSDSIKGKRCYFSFIATANEEKNFPLFIEFIKNALKRDSDFMAQIVTRSNIAGFWNKELDEYVKNGRLLVQSGRNLTNEEINNALERSACTWLYYYHSTQSGVLARAFMCGSPVLCSTSGCFKNYVHGNNGVICKDDSIEGIYAAYKEVYENNEKMSIEAKKSFAQFEYSNSVDMMREILEKELGVSA